MSLTKQILATHRLDYSGEVIVGVHDMHHIVDVLYDKTSPEQVKAAYLCFDELLIVFSDKGYGTCRVKPAFMDKVAHLRASATQCPQDTQEGARPEWHHLRRASRESASGKTLARAACWLDRLEPQQLLSPIYGREGGEREHC